jgi:MSHA biogenesis protein MshE
MRRTCDSCAEPAELTAQQRVWVARQVGGSSFGSTEFLEGTGCTYCNMTGYRGRIGIYELLEVDASIADAIRRADIAELTRLAHSQAGFVPLARRALDYAAQGVTSVLEVMRVTSGLEEVGQATTLLDDVLTSEEHRQEAAS